MSIAVVCFCFGLSQTFIRKVFKQNISNEIQRMMKFWKPFLLVLWITGIIVLLIYYIIPKEDTQRNDTIEKLERANQVLVLKNETLDKKINRLKDQTDSLSDKIKLSHQTIQQLQQNLNEQIKTIDRMSSLDLYKYFSRFKTDSTRHKQ
jgi:peptidoglycan hydrolase CwlO-like protein